MPWYFVIYYIIMTLGALTGAFRFRHLSSGSKWLLVLLTITLITEIANNWVGKVYRTNLIISHFFSIIQCGLLVLAYRYEMKNFKLLSSISLLFILILGVFNIVSNYSILSKQYPTTLKTIYSIIIFCWTLLYLRKMLYTELSDSFVNYPLFWISIGWLIFTVLTLVNFSLFNYIGHYALNFSLLFQYIRIVANFQLYSLFIIAFLTKQKTLK